MLEKKKRVVLEPELEEMAGDWGPIKRLDMAVVFERWARQLKVSALIMVRDADDSKVSFSQRLRRVRRGLPRRKASLN